MTVADTCFVSCPKSGLKVILHYLEEGWLGKTQNKVEGIIYKCDVLKDKTTRLKDVPDKDVIGRVDGAWTDKVYFSMGSAPFNKVAVGHIHPFIWKSVLILTQDKDKVLLIDVNPLYPAEKIVPAAADQLPNESRRFWNDVTEAILAKQFTQATNVKQEMEERQRQKAAERKARNVEWKPRFFTAATTTSGRPELTEDGKVAMNRLHVGDYRLEPSVETGA